MHDQNHESIFDFELTEVQAVPVGQYIAILKDIQKTKHDQYGDGVMFCFEIAAGEYKGETAVRIGKPWPTLENVTGKMIMGITGKQTVGRFDLRPYIGKPYNIVLEAHGKKTRVSSVWPYAPQTMSVSQQFPPPHQQPGNGYKNMDIEGIPF